MAIQPAVCTMCGGSIQVDDIDLNGFCKCEFCGNSLKVIDVITIDGLPTVKSLLTNADFLVQDGNAERAESNYKQVLQIKPNCHEAWWGLYLCNRYYDRYYGYRDKYGNSGPMTKAAIMAGTIEKYAIRAIEYAPNDMKSVYRSRIQDEMNFINSVKNGSHDRTTSSGSSGCYIATAVYGSYTCPQVLTLRRFRDDYLAKHFWGRAFIRVYYAISPTLARHIRPSSPLGRFIRRVLDKAVDKLSIEPHRP